VHSGIRIHRAPVKNHITTANFICIDDLSFHKLFELIMPRLKTTRQPNNCNRIW
jgi:hypothetical protein